MYQSPGMFRIPPRLSLGILKCAISGASPLCGHIATFNELKSEDRMFRDVRLCLVHGHARVNELDASRPITATEVRELLRPRRHTHAVMHDRARAGRAQQKVPTQEADEKVLLRG